jgi:hypothetical protein
MRSVLTVIPVAILVLSPLVASGAESASSFDITLKKSENRLTTTATGDSVIFTVTSPSGIGLAVIAPKNGKWPKTIVLRLRLSGLESLSVNNGKTTWAAEVSSHGDNRALQRLIEEGKDKKEKPIERGDPNWTEIKTLDAQGKPADKIPVKDGYFELTLPAPLLDGGPKSLTISWIDFYR